MKRLLFGLIATTLNTAGCAPVCQTEATRCRGSRVDICDADGQWQPVMDCAEVIGIEGAAWSCCLTSDADAGTFHTCLPQGECGGAQ